MGREVRRRRDDAGRPRHELADLEVRIVGLPARAAEAAAVMRSYGVTVRGPYPRRDEDDPRVTYYAQLASGEQLAPALPPAARDATP